MRLFPWFTRRSQLPGDPDLQRAHELWMLEKIKAGEDPQACASPEFYEAPAVEIPADER